MLEEIYYSRFLFIGQSSNKSICGIWILPASVSTDASAREKYGCNCDIHNRSSIGATAGSGHSWGWDTCGRSFADHSADGKHGCNWDIRGRSSTGTSTGGEHSCNWDTYSRSFVGIFAGSKYIGGWGMHNAVSTSDFAVARHCCAGEVSSWSTNNDRARLGNDGSICRRCKQIFIDIIIRSTIRLAYIYKL